MSTPVTVLSFTTPAISGISEALLDDPEAPVGGELGVACDQEVKVQTVVELVHGPPGTVAEHKLNSFWQIGRSEDLIVVPLALPAKSALGLVLEMWGSNFPHRFLKEDSLTARTSRKYRNNVRSIKVVPIMLEVN